jgi:hypothetical protein
MDIAAPSKEVLVKDHKQLVGKLYDEDSILELKPSMASGFVILLAGGPTGKKKTKKADVNLGFLALTEGNVLDACFGVVSSSRGKNTPATRSAREGKDLLGNAGYTSDDFKRIAVEGYCEAFEVAVVYHEEFGRLNCITRCFKTKGIRKKAQKNLRVAFLNVAKAITESNSS